MDAVGRALLERDDNGVRRIPEVDYSFEIVGDSIDELGLLAFETAQVFYGTVPFRITGMSVNDAPSPLEGFIARVQAEVRK